MNINLNRWHRYRVAPVFVICLMGVVANGAVVNEYWADDAGGDGVEYIELFGSGGESLNGLSLLVVDGDTGGSTTSANYRRVTVQIDFTTETIPGDGFLVISNAATPNQDIDLSTSLWGSSLQNGSQTYALVRTQDIAYHNRDVDELTQQSIDDITANLIDVLGTLDGSVGDRTYFGAPVNGPNGAGFNWDTASRIPNGVDTDSSVDWTAQDSFPLSIELGDVNDLLSSPGTANRLIPEPAALVLLGILAFGAISMRKRFG